MFDTTVETIKKISIIQTKQKSKIVWLVKLNFLFESSDVHISPDGKFLYATNRGKENNIAIFKVLNDGKLESIGYKKTGGKHPRTFAIDETGKFIIVNNVGTNSAVVFKRNLETGMMKKIGKPVHIENVSCVKTKMYK